jgi:PIN domain nuclease of toxin-antitoxin system
MNLLLDTHTLIWIFDRSPNLSPAARDAITDGSNLVYVSSVTAWEIAIKRAAGKLRLKGDYQRGLARYRFTPLNITTEHALAVEALPSHHNDPFDRMLIAQAQLERLTLVTRDRKMNAYGVPIIEA